MFSGMVLRRALILVLVVACVGSAWAELQNATVGGEVRIRGRYWNNTYNGTAGGPQVVRIPAARLRGRPIGPFGTGSRFHFDNDGPDLAIVEMRTRLNVRADFTDNVGAFIEFESYDFWGEDFRSNYVTGVDMRAATGNDVEVYQAYIETNDMFGYPLRLRIGRQEMKYGKGWLMDDIATAIIGRSWDAVRLTYSTDSLDVDVWWSKLAENFAAEKDGDIDFYGVYATYKGWEKLDLSAYWLLIRDGRSIRETQGAPGTELMEDILGFDNYDPTYLNTVGLRAFGACGAWDYDVEVAYQFGNADQVGSRFAPFGTYGDTGARFGNLAFDAELGYSLDFTWKPRIYVGGAFFEGEDNRDITLGEWLLGSFNSPTASVSFNRLFPGKNYTPILGIGQEITNFWQIRTGVKVKPTDKIAAGLRLAYFAVDEPFDLPRFGGLSFLTREASDDIGWTTFFFVKYDYSDDLYFKFVWEHLFTGDALEQGNFMARNGLEFVGGTDGDDADYVALEARLQF